MDGSQAFTGHRIDITSIPEGVKGLPSADISGAFQKALIVIQTLWRTYSWTPVPRKRMPIDDSPERVGWAELITDIEE